MNNIKKVYQFFLKRINFKSNSFRVVFILVTLGLMIGNFIYSNYKKNISDETILIKKISKHMILPDGNPTIFTVQDPSILVSQQAFFKGAEKGDSLVIYSDTGKAIIYSKKRDLIINVGPVTFDQNKNMLLNKAILSSKNVKK